MSVTDHSSEDRLAHLRERWDVMEELADDPVIRRCSAFQRNQMLALPEHERFYLLIRRTEDVMKWLVPDDRAALFSSIHHVASHRDIMEARNGSGPYALAASELAQQGAVANADGSDQASPQIVTSDSVALATTYAHTERLAEEAGRAFHEAANPASVPRTAKERLRNLLRARWILASLLLNCLDGVYEFLESRGIDPETVRARAHLQISEQRGGEESSMVVSPVAIAVVKQPIELRGLEASSGMVVGTMGGEVAPAISGGRTDDEENGEEPVLLPKGFPLFGDQPLQTVPDAVAALRDRPAAASVDGVQLVAEYRHLVTAASMIEVAIGHDQPPEAVLAFTIQSPWLDSKVRRHPLQPVLSAISHRRMALCKRVAAEPLVFAPVLGMNAGIRSRIDKDIAVLGAMEPAVAETARADAPGSTTASTVGIPVLGAPSPALPLPQLSEPIGAKGAPQIRFRAVVGVAASALRKFFSALRTVAGSCVSYSGKASRLYRAPKTVVFAERRRMVTVLGVVGCCAIVVAGAVAAWERHKVSVAETLHAAVDWFTVSSSGTAFDGGRVVIAKIRPQADVVAVRDAPTSTAHVVGTLALGYDYGAVDRSGDGKWWRLRIPTAQGVVEGWVDAGVVTASK
jgi:hypothetical protein